MISSNALLLGVDIGSSSIKSTLYDFKGICRKESKIPLPVDEKGNRYEISADILWKTFVRSIQQLGELLSDVVTIGVTSQMAGFLILNVDGTVPRPVILGVDQRGEPFIPRLDSLLGAKEIYETTGCPLKGIYPSTKWLWLVEEEPAMAASAKRLGGIKEYILWKLTGNWVTDPACASATQLYNQQQQSWWGELLLKIGIDLDMMPQILNPDEVAGFLREESAKELSLSPGLPVAVGTGDGPAANLSTGAISDKELCLSFGTTAVARFATQEPTTFEIGQPYFQQHFGDQLYFQGVRMDEAGKWIDHYFPTSPVDRCQTNHVNVFFNIFTKDPEKFTGDYHTLSESERFDLVLEGIIFGMYLLIKPFVDRHPFSEIRPTGGGIANRNWMQTTANLFGLPVVTTKSNSSSLGAAILAAKASGYFTNWSELIEGMIQPDQIIQPQSDQTDLLQQRWEQYASLVKGELT